MKVVNFSFPSLVLLLCFGATLFGGMLIVDIQQAYAPKGDIVAAPTDPSGIGRSVEITNGEVTLGEGDDQLTVPTSGSFLFVGDLMMARAVEQSIARSGPDAPFALWELPGVYDTIIGNFEGTVREQERVESVNVMAFDTLPAYIPALASAGFTHLSLSNNHTDDFGDATTAFTRTTITENDITPFGDPFTSEQYVARIAGDIPVSLIGFHAFNETTESLVEAIRAEDTAGQFVIMYPHWGVEYAHTASATQEQAARMWIEAGADLIIGAHPHVVQNVTTLEGVPVIYSLGNFLFDQDFSHATQVGSAVAVTVRADEIAFQFYPIRIEDRAMRIDETLADDLRAWLQLPELTWTVARE